MNKNAIEDPLKPLDKIYEPDERQSNFCGDLSDIHGTLDHINLNASVPISVKQLFETAKNLTLYSRFVYRFHQPAELISFAAVEMALRERFLLENPKIGEFKKGTPALHGLLQHVKKQKWLTNEGFPSRYTRAKYNAQMVKMTEIVKSRRLNEGQSLTTDEPTEDEIRKELSTLDMVAAITDYSHKIRNNLAHGSETLHWSSISTLVLNAEVINQIYP